LATHKRLGNLRSCLLVGFADGADGPRGAADTVVIAPDGFAVPLEDGEFALDRFQIAVNVAGVPPVDSCSGVLAIERWYSG
jgi:hypothetical protein